MDEHDEWLAERFEEHRARLRAVAYRMLGSTSEADDAVQETWLRLSRSDTSEVENLGGWLTTVLGRVCLDMLRSRKSRREESLGARVPEPIAGRADGADPEQEALLSDSVGLALLVVLETLTPAERLAFIHSFQRHLSAPTREGSGHFLRAGSHPPARGRGRLPRRRARWRLRRACRGARP